MTLTNPENLSTQYANASNLDSRITLHRNFSVNKTPWHRWTFDRLDLPSNARILELGCGNAASWTENRERIPETWSIKLTDSSPGMTADAKRNINLHFRNILTRNFTFMSTDARRLSFGDGCFDAVVANHMLYHMPDLGKVFSEVARVLASGGVFYAATNGRGHMREVDAMIRTLDPDHREYGLARNFSGFTLENGAAQIEEHFSEVSVVRHEDELRVTDAAPLMAWILSTITVREIAERVGRKKFERRVLELSESLKNKISERGEVRISKDAGLFVARA